MRKKVEQHFCCQFVTISNAVRLIYQGRTSYLIHSWSLSEVRNRAKSELVLLSLDAVNGNKIIRNKNFCEASAKPKVDF